MGFWELPSPLSITSREATAWLAQAAKARGLLPCAVIDGKGWSERPGALVDIVIAATDGRTYFLATLAHILEIPEIAAAAL